MNKKILPLILAGVGLLLIGGAVLLYSLLAGKIAPENSPVSASSSALASGSVAPSDDSSDAAEPGSSQSSSISESGKVSSSVSASASQSTSSSSVASSQAPASSSETSSSAASSPTLPASFTVYTESGEAVTLASKAGKPIVVNFWATWCPYCVQEMADFQSVYNEYGSRVNFMMVDLADGQRETVEGGAAYIREKGFSFPVYYDTSYSAASAFSVRFMPTTVIFNADGDIIYNNAGALTASTLRQLLDTALN